MVGVGVLREFKEQNSLELCLGHLGFIFLNEMLLDFKCNLDSILLFHFDQCQDPTHEKPREHVEVLLKLDLDFYLVIL